MCHCTVIQPIWTDFPAAGAKEEEEEEEEEGRGRSIVVFCRCGTVVCQDKYYPGKVVRY